MTREEFKKFREDICTEINILMDQKNADYCAGGSVFSNFEATEEIGIPSLNGLIIRMLDKFQRVKSFAKSGALQVEGEGVDDAFRDLIGYCLIALGMRQASSESGLGEWEKICRGLCPPQFDYCGNSDEVEEEVTDKLGDRPFMEVGGTYKDRCGNTVTIAEITVNDCYPFWGDNELSYTSKGTYYTTDESDNDLIERLS